MSDIKSILNWISKEEIKANKVLVNLEDKGQYRLDWDAWWNELKNNYPEYIRAYERKEMLDKFKYLINELEVEKQ